MRRLFGIFAGSQPLFSRLFLITSVFTVAFTCGFNLDCRAQKQPDNFTFLDISDTHQTAAGSTEPLRRLAQTVVDQAERPAFIVDTGDITEAGRQEEYAAFKDAIAGLAPAKVGFYAVPGNHDVRWSPNGKEDFAHAFGKLYQSFDYAATHFILLDSTVALEHWGHIDKSELDWLEKDLKKQKADTPIFVFLHHSIGRDTPSTRFVDNEYDLIKRLRGHNVIAIFTGHGHEDLEWKTNGIETLMTRGLYQGSYYKVSVTPVLVNIDRVYTLNPGPRFHVSLPIQRRTKTSQLKAGWDDPDVPFLERRRPAATLEPRAVSDNPDTEKAEYRLDDAPWKPLTKDARDIWRDVFPTKTIPVGIHSADIRLTTSSGVAFSDELIFEIERTSSEPTRKWALDLDGPIQSSPVLDSGSLYVSSLDGRVYALTTDKGKKRWTYPTKGPLLASPLVVGDTLFIGSSDHFVYAIDSLNGKMRWKTDTGGAVLATAAEAQGIICVGGNQKIYGLDRRTGSIVWSQPAGNFFQSRAATDGAAFYLGGWDNMVYALDARSGTPKWTRKIGKSFYYAPAIASPEFARGRVYICSNDNTLHSLDARSGDEIWAVSPPKGGDPVGYSSPHTVGNNLYVAGIGDNGDVYCFNATTGSFRWRASTRQTIYNSSVKIAPDGQSLAIMGVRGKVSVLDTGSGKRLWGYELGPGNIFSTPEYDGNIVYTTTMANDVQAINAPGAGEVHRSAGGEIRSTTLTSALNKGYNRRAFMRIAR